MMDSTSAGNMLNVADLVQYYYCPRKVYFLKVMGTPFVSKKKMEYGGEEHRREIKRLSERKDIFGIAPDMIENIFKKLYVENSAIGLCGQIDFVLKLKDGAVIPVDIKYSDYVEVQRHWKKQLTAYAILLDFKFNCEVSKGILYFSKQNEQLAVDISSEDKKFVIMDLKMLLELIKSERIPRKADESKCRYCEVLKWCV